MKLIVGLGNPGEKYKHTRHNVGFAALDYFLKTYNSQSATDYKFRRDKKSNAEIAEIIFNQKKNILVKPQTFMNNSGAAVSQLTAHYKLPTANLLVVHDEIDLPFTAIRVSQNISSAGHKGVQDIIEKLGTQEFSRLRIGIESRAETDPTPTENFVLQNFTTAEAEQLRDEILPRVAKEILAFLSD